MKTEPRDKTEKTLQLIAYPAAKMCYDNKFVKALLCNRAKGGGRGCGMEVGIPGSVARCWPCLGIGGMRMMF